MQIDTIDATNFKGSTFQAKFTHPITMIIGLNFVGKSKILQAIVLAFLGWIPGVSKKDRDIFDIFSSGSGMSVALNIAGKYLIEHAWVKKGDKVTADHRPPAGMGQMPIVALNAQAYFAMPAQERINLIFKSMRLEDVPMSKRVADLRRKLESSGLEAPANLIAAQQTAEGDSFQDFIERSLVIVAEKAAENEAAEKRMQQTVNGLAHLDNQAGTEAPGAGALASIGARIATARDELEKLVAKHATAKAPFEVGSNIRQQRARHQELMRKSEPLAKLLSERKAAMEAAAAKTVVKVDLANFAAAFARAEAHALGASSAVDAVNNQLKDFEDEQAKLAAKPACWTCKRPFTKGKVNEAAVAEVQRLREQFIASKDVAEKQNLAAAQALTVARSEYDRAKQQFEEYGKAEAAREAAVAALTQAQRAYDQYEESKQALEALGGSNGGSQDDANALQGMAEEIEVKRDEIAVLEKQEQAGQQAKGSLQKLAEARQEAQRYAKLKGAYKDAGKVLKESREGFIADGFKPLLKTCNMFGEGILRSPLEYRDGNIGRMQDGNWVTMPAFSGAEESITYAAINAALGASAPARIVLMDELTKLDVPNKKKFIQNVLVAYKAGIIEQFIGVDTDATAYEKLNEEALADNPEQKEPIVKIARLA